MNNKYLDGELIKKFLVKSEKQAYEDWMNDLIPIIRGYVRKGIRVHVFKGDIVDVSCLNRNLTMNEKIRISNVAEKYLLCLSKLKEDKDGRNN